MWKLILIASVVATLPWLKNALLELSWVVLPPLAIMAWFYIQSKSSKTTFLLNKNHWIDIALMGLGYITIHAAIGAYLYQAGWDFSKLSVVSGVAVALLATGSVLYPMVLRRYINARQDIPFSLAFMHRGTAILMLFPPLMSVVFMYLNFKG